MSSTAEVVIVGAGIVGASAAYRLTEFGVHKVIVFERRVPPAGATGKSGALVRLHYPNPFETHLALESSRFFQQWEMPIGAVSPFTRTGFLQTVSPDDTEKLRLNVTMQRELGAPVELLNSQEVAELEPWRDVSTLSLAAYEPESGYADPVAATVGFLDQARRHGAEIRNEEAVQCLTHQGHRIIGVQTNRGVTQSPFVILTTGAWSN